MNGRNARISRHVRYEQSVIETGGDRAGFGAAHDLHGPAAVAAGEKMIAERLAGLA